MSIASRHCPTNAGPDHGLAGIAASPQHLGPGAFARAVRDGLLHSLTDALAVPAPFGDLPPVRAAALAHAVPGSTALTGVAALWVHGWLHPQPMRWPVTVAVSRGARVDPPAWGGAGWQCVTDTRGAEAAITMGGVRVCAAGPAVTMALAHDDLRWALPAAWWALDVGVARQREIHALLSRSGYLPKRARRSWRTLIEARQGAL